MDLVNKYSKVQNPIIMSTKGIKELEAIDLLIQDLNTVHCDIRTEAKERGCEKELDEWKEHILEYLSVKRGKI